MNNEQQQLEAAGYTFHVREQQPVTEQSLPTTYHVVSIGYKGEPLGTRSELKRERALARAVAFALAHQEEQWQR
jgi:hypothetical protein